jgi:transcriptional regulator with XRE-family HTH domain
MKHQVKFGKAIAKFRKQRGYSQKQFAEMIGMDAPHLCMIEKDKRKPLMASIEKICNGLDIPFVFLTWYSITEDDVDSSKKEIFKMLKPSVDSLLNELFKEKGLKYG